MLLKEKNISYESRLFITRQRFSASTIRSGFQDLYSKQDNNWFGFFCMSSVSKDKQSYVLVPK